MAPKADAESLSIIRFTSVREAISNRLSIYSVRCLNAVGVLAVAACSRFDETA